MSLRSRFFIMNEDEYSPLAKYPQELLLGYIDKCSVGFNLDLDSVEFYWSPQLRDWGVRVVFVQYRPNAIFLAPVHNPFDRENMPKHALTQDLRDSMRLAYKENIKAIAPIAIHELTHMEQFDKMGRIRYSLCSMPILYDKILDNPAFQNERIAAYDLDLPVDLYGREGQLLLGKV